MIQRITGILSLLIIGTSACAQGMLFDTTRYEEVQTFDPRTLLGFTVQEMPEQISLRDYAPYPIDQTGNSCVGVATTYEALTIMHNRSLGITNTFVNTIRAFDPYCVYNQIALAPGCSQGTYTEDALEALEEMGAKKMWMDPFLDCYSDIGANIEDQSETFMIHDYKKLFDWDDEVKYETVQQVVATGTPVVIAMYAPASLWREDMGGNVGEDGLWRLDYDDRFYSWSGHAMSVIGYDDEKFGGAFEIMNSWGRDYGDDGFLWVKYDDFEDMCYGAYYMEIQDYRRNSGCVTGDCESGYGIQRFKNGDIYEGYFAGSEYAGFGIYTFNDGSAYIGNWTNGVLDGTVIEIFDNMTYRLTTWTNGVQDKERMSDIVEETIDYEFLNSLSILEDYSFTQIRVRPGTLKQRELQKVEP